MNRAYALVPEGIDDPARPSGGNRYDRRVLAELGALGWDVTELRSPADVRALPDGAVLLADALVACANANLLVAAARRLRLVVLAHMPFGKCPVLAAAAAVVTTSAATRSAVLGAHPDAAVHVAAPGVDRAEPVRGTAAGARLLCVGVVAPHKGQDVLVAALAQLCELSWSCVCVGSLAVEPAYSAQVRHAASGLPIELPGPALGADLDARYAAADVLVLPSRQEGYGMVVTEALARGVPVIASDLPGIREALGPDRPGLLVAPADPDALAGAVRSWLTEARLRADLRARAAARRADLLPWRSTARRISTVLSSI